MAREKREWMWKSAMNKLKTVKHIEMADYLTRFLASKLGVERLKGKLDFINANPDIWAGLVAIITNKGVVLARVLDGYPHREEILKKEGYIDVINNGESR